MTDVNSSLMEQLLNVTLAERKAVVKPQSIPNHAQGEAVSIGLAVSHSLAAYQRLVARTLSAHADRGGLIGLISRYAPGKVLLTHGELGPRSNLAGYLNTRYDVNLPTAGEEIELRDSGRRKGAFINTSPKKLEALKEKHARAAVQVRYDPESHEVRISLPEKLSGDLFGDGNYTLEVLRGKLSRIKLNQRDPDALAGQVEGSE